MPELRHEEHSPNLGLNDILFALFKHKGKILLCAIAGLIAAAAVYYFYPPVYESQAKLLVRYVLDRSSVDPIESTSGSNASAQAKANVLGSEVEILTSWDLAVQVAEVLGAKKLLPGSGNGASKEAAAATVSSGLEVGTSKGSDIIFVSYKNSDPALATLVLDELVKRYFNKHLEVHRSAAAFEFVTQQTDQVRARLGQTEDALKVLKDQAGILSLVDSKTTITAEAVRTQDQLHSAEAELAEQRARVQQMEESQSEPDPEPAGRSRADSKQNRPETSRARDGAAREAGSGDVQQYQALVERLAGLRQAKLDLLSKYTPENELVKRNQSQIDDLEKQRRNLEKKFPDLGAKASTTGSQPDLASEKARLAGIEAKTETLKSRLHDVQEQIKQLSDAGSRITDLERQRELEEANYKYFQGTLEKARVDEALDPSKMPNISAVQRPSPPRRVFGKRNKIVLGLAGCGLALGLAFALLNELVLNRTVKRPLELETQLRTPLLVSIPYTGSNGHLLLRGPDEGGEPTDLETAYPETAPWELDHFIRPYTEAIRDRLGLYFKLNGMTHKPKLVGVTGFSEGAGASTLAAGLAAALSETGDGKVLLVDVNVGSEEVHPFFKGRPAYPLTTALQPSGSSGSMASAADGLYLATALPRSSGPMQLALKRFFDLMPNFKASDFDYIIFDMPPLGQTTPTLGMAGFMDKLLLVVEAEKTHRDLVKRGFAELVAGRANVSIVFNKARSYAPKWLEGGL